MDTPSVESRSSEGPEDESADQSELPLHPRIAFSLWVIAGFLLVSGASGAASRLPGGGAMLLIGVGLTGFLIVRRGGGSVGVIVGILIGTNVFAIWLLLRPPCRSLDDLEVVRRRGQVEVICNQLGETADVAVPVFVGTVVIFGLLLLLRWLGLRAPQQV